MSQSNLYYVVCAQTSSFLKGRVIVIIYTILYIDTRYDYIWWYKILSTFSLYLLKMDGAIRCLALNSNGIEIG